MKASDLTFDIVLGEPLLALQTLLDSLVRNLGAESWLWLQIGLALGLGILVDLTERRDMVKRYLSRNFRVDATYALVDLLHIAHFTIIMPAGLFLTTLMQTHLPGLRIAALANLPAWAQLLILFTFTDFCVYWYHRAQHMNIVLWQFHKTHHSQEHMTALTVFRMPIFDRLVTLAVLTVPATVMDVSYAYPIGIVTVIYFHQLMVHSGVGWSLGPLGWLIVSPQFHEVHHSTAPEHIDKNFGGALAIWDRIFGTYVAHDGTPLTWGLVGERVPESFLGQIFVPFVGIHGLVRRRWRRARARAQAAPQEPAE
jgi:sterol desaturase/sphingolipid hydroxylase (fatty acid hydroxylase superfamily)